MNVSLQNIDKVSALLTVKLEKADYQEKVDKSLKNLRQKAQIPGFRKGMVPMSLVKKMYGKSVLAEEVNKLLSDSVYKYIQDNKVSILANRCLMKISRKILTSIQWKNLNSCSTSLWLRNSRLRFLLMIRWITIQLM